MGRLLVVTLRRWSALVTGRSSAFNGLNGLVVPWGRSKRLGLHRPGGLGGGRTGVGFAIDDPGLSNPTKGCPREGDRGFKQMPTCDLSKPRLSGIYIYISIFQLPAPKQYGASKNLVTLSPLFGEGLRTHRKNQRETAGSKLEENGIHFHNSHARAL